MTVAEEQEKVQTLRATRPHHHQGHGFTLIDLVMVLSVLAVMVAIAVPRVNSGTQRYKAEATARRLAADLEWARAEAIARSESIEVYFDFAGHTYFLYNIESINHDYVDNWVQLQHEPYGAQLNNAFGFDVNDSGMSLFFDGHGKPDRNGNIQVQVGDIQREVSVDGESGRIAVIPLDP